MTAWSKLLPCLPKPHQRIFRLFTASAQWVTNQTQGSPAGRIICFSFPWGTLSILKWERENPDDGEATDREILCVFYPLKNPIKSLLLWIWCKGKFQKWKWSISVWGEESQKGKRQFFFSAKCPKLISWIQSEKLGGLDQQCWDQQQRMDFLEGMSQGNSVSWRLLLKFPPQSIPGDFSQSSKNRASRIDRFCINH